MNQVKTEEMTPSMSVDAPLNFPPMAMSTAALPQQVPTGYMYLEDGLHILMNDNVGNQMAYQVSSGLPQGENGDKPHSSRKPKEEAMKQKVTRLNKNREAARMSRQRKKLYIRNLENRAAKLENENKTLKETIESLKCLYGNQTI